MTTTTTDEQLAFLLEQQSIGELDLSVSAKIAESLVRGRDGQRGRCAETRANVRRAAP